MTYQLSLPDEFIREARNRFGKDNPGTDLRNLLFKAFYASPAAQAAAKADNRRPWGTRFVASFDSACRRCGRRIVEGAEAWKCDAGNLHQDCYDAWVEEQNAEGGAQ